MANTPELSVPAVWSSTLPNGMQIKGIEYGELPLVNFSIELNQGMLLDAPGKVGVAYLTAQMLNEGTASKTPEQLEEAIGQLGASIRVACSPRVDDAQRPLPEKEFRPGDGVGRGDAAPSALGRAVVRRSQGAGDR